MSEFYKQYFELENDEAEIYKEEYIRKSIKNNMLYKFVGFDKNIELNKSKLNLFENDLIWSSHIKYFEDKSELKTPFNIRKVAKATHITKANIQFKFNALRELYDVSCFTKDITDFMWENYANSYNGFCLCFDILDYDKLYPVVYLNKNKVDLTESIIESVNDIQSKSANLSSKEAKKVSILPIVLKDEKYKYEKEIRFFFCPFDDENGEFGGLVFPNIKNEFNYKGTPVSYDYIGIKLKKIIIGYKCNEIYKTKLIDISKSKGIEIEKDTTYYNRANERIKTNQVDQYHLNR